MKVLVLIAALILSNLVLASPVDSCLENINQSLRIAENRAASGGYAGSPQSVTECMIIAMSKARCYSEKDPSKLCQIKLNAMLEAGRNAGMQGGGRVSDSWITQEAKRISGC